MHYTKLVSIVVALADGLTEAHEARSPSGPTQIGSGPHDPPNFSDEKCTALSSDQLNHSDKRCRKGSDVKGAVLDSSTEWCVVQFRPYIALDNHKYEENEDCRGCAFYKTPIPASARCNRMPGDSSLWQLFPGKCDDVKVKMCKTKRSWVQDGWSADRLE